METMEDIEDLCLTFSVTRTSPEGSTEEIELVEGGSSIDVTAENVHIFIQLKAAYILQEEVRAQLTALRYGFNEIIPPAVLSTFSMEEVEQLLCGSVIIDVQDWKANTIIIGFQSNSPTILWFWSILEEMDNEDRTDVFQFVTGTTKVPHGGMFHERVLYIIIYITY